LVLNKFGKRLLLMFNFSIESNYHNNVYRNLFLTYFFGGVMPRSKKISISLIMFFLLFILCLGTMAHAQPVNNQNCKNIAKKMMNTDIKIKKIHKQMKHVIEAATGKESQNYPPIDRFNRHVNILIHNLGFRVGSMKELIEDAKKEGNNCQKMASKISGNVDAMHDIYVNMGISLENPKTSGSKLFDLNKNLEQQTNGTSSELQSAVKSF
jgi:hypothetical protein